MSEVEIALEKCLFYYYDNYFDHFKWLYCCYRDYYYYFNALKVSCNEITIFAREYQDLWQLTPDPLVNLPFPQLGQKEFFKLPLGSCRSVGVGVWYENSQFRVFLTSFFRSSGKNLSYVDSTAPTSVGGDFGLFLVSVGAAKNCCFPKGQVLLDWVWLWGCACTF